MSDALDGTGDRNAFKTGTHARLKKRIDGIVRSGVILSVLGFAGMSVAVMRGFTNQVDRNLLLALRSPESFSDPLGPVWLEEAVAEFSALGGYPIMAVVCVIVLIALALARQKLVAMSLAGVVSSGALISNILKIVFDRPRPDLVEHLDRTFTSSFPSGHAMLGVVVWMSLAAIAVGYLQNRLVTIFILIAAFVLAILIGLSRVYLGVHWPSDVLAGWFAGFVWVGLCWFVWRHWAPA